MNRIYIFLLLLAASMCTLASSLSAEEIVSAKVPFAFSVANRTLPAGEYRFVQNGAFLHIEKCNDHQSVTLIANLGAPVDNGRTYLSFDHVNGVFFLRQVVNQYATNTVELAISATKTGPEHRTASSPQMSLGR